MSPASRRPLVIFDIDGTLLDSAIGIVSGYRHALTAVGFPPPSDEVLRSDLGPPVRVLFERLGVPEVDLDPAREAYQEYYLRTGLAQAAIYDGVVEMLRTLAGQSMTLATATAKRTTTAAAFLAHHDLAQYFDVIGGTDETRITKTDTIEHVLAQLGDPDPAQVVMVGDRHSDITGGLDCGISTVGVTWGYGTTTELRTAGAHHIVHSPADLTAFLRETVPVSAD